MEILKRKYRLTGITPILGSVSLNKQIYTDYIASKAKTPEEKSKAQTDVNCVKDEEDKVTGFYRDAETNNLVLKDYQIKGFLKDAAKALKDQIGLTAHVSKIDNFVFIKPEFIPLMRDGQQLQNPDSFLERPLRGETAQGPRVSLAKSEMVDRGWYLDIEISVVVNKKTAKSKAIDFDVIEELLSYGELKGLLQWRNGGYGSFTYECLD